MRALHDVLGHFALWADVPPTDLPLSGRLARDPETGELLLSGLDPDATTSLSQSLGGSVSHPSAVIGTTEADGVVLLNVSDEGGRSSLFGYTASTRRYKATTAVVKVPLNDIRRPRVAMASATFPLALPWAGLQVLDETVTTDDLSGSVRDVSYSTKSTGESTAIVSSGLTLCIRGDWAVERVDSDPLIRTGLYASVEARRARSPEGLLQPLLALQDLLGVAHGRAVAARACTLRMEGCEDPSPMWDWRLTEGVVRFAKPLASTSLPRFRIQDIGDVAGVARWMRLCREHHRAVAPLRAGRLGARTPDQGLRDLAAAMEYWVATHSRTTRWSKSGKSYAECIALRVPSLAHLLTNGKIRSWGNTFWATYNDLKHNPAASVDAQKVQALYRTGLIVLECALLNRIAGSRTPEACLEAHHSTKRIAEEVKALGLV